jgi:hypothetical protein
MPIGRRNRGLRFAQTGQFFVITGHKDAANEEKTRRNGEEDARTTRRYCGLGAQVAGANKGPSRRPCEGMQALTGPEPVSPFPPELAPDPARRARGWVLLG